MDKPNEGKSQVTARLTISCGCGFLAQSMKEAGAHAGEKGHVLTVHGQIGKVEKLSGVREVRR